jgi:hypothetical protein
MKHWPDILTSAGFWASVATSWSAAGAWAAFVGTLKASKQQTYDGVLNLISGIEAELTLIEPWASPYPQSDSDEALAKKHTDWFNPSRQIFTFDTPTLNDLTSSSYVRYLAPVVPDFVRLNYSIRRLFDFIKIYQSFVYSDAELYSDVFISVTAGKRPVGRGLIYSNVVFGMNKKIHIELIGGEDSKDEDCLHKAFWRARKTLKHFKDHFQPERLPKWYWILHIAAGYLALNGIWQVTRWVR